MVALAMNNCQPQMQRCSSEGCVEDSNLALCELCMHWVCPMHRMLIGESKKQAISVLGGGLTLLTDHGSAGASLTSLSLSLFLTDPGSSLTNMAPWLLG